jgi:hypothetical protein
MRRFSKKVDESTLLLLSFILVGIRLALSKEMSHYSRLFLSDLGFTYAEQPVASRGTSVHIFCS